MAAVNNVDEEDIPNSDLLAGNDGGGGVVGKVGLCLDAAKVRGVLILVQAHDCGAWR